MGKLKYRKKKNGLFLKIFLVISALVALFWYLDVKLQQTISTMVSYQIKVYATQALNTAVLNELEKQDIQYDDLIALRTGENNQVNAIETQAIEISRLKANISNSVEEKLHEPIFQSVGIPLGTVLGIPWLSGYGPPISFRLIPQGSVHTNLLNRFDSAGINQTRHQIMLDIEIEFTAVIPGFSTEFITESNFCIAETIIVGPIPDAYTNVEDGNSENMADINDYDANDARVKKYIDDILE